MSVVDLGKVIGPQGPAGPQGPQGVPGAKGEKGGYWRTFPDKEDLRKRGCYELRIRIGWPEYRKLCYDRYWKR